MNKSPESFMFLAYSSKATRWTFMTRYKGRNKTKFVERDFPHHVDMMVPEFGFGTHLDAMYDWHHTRGVLALHGSGRRDENGRCWVRWCFVDSKLAEAFAAEFAAFTLKK
jgi:hypothetical protein